MDGRDDILSISVRRRLGNERRFSRADAELTGVPTRRRLLFSPISQYVLISPLPYRRISPSSVFPLISVLPDSRTVGTRLAVVKVSQSDLTLTLRLI